jgi:hypothetical protein
MDMTHRPGDTVARFQHRLYPPSAKPTAFTYGSLFLHLAMHERPAPHTVDDR